MSSAIRTAALLGFTCLSAAAFAAPALADEPAAAPAPLEAFRHGADYATVIQNMDTLVANSGKVSPDAATSQALPAADVSAYVAGGPTVAETPAAELPVPMGDTTAAEAATPAAGDSGASCDAYFIRSQALAPALAAAFKAMSAHDPKAESDALPALQTQLDGFPAAEIKAESCGGTHVNAYTVQQFVELNTLTAHGVDTGFPAGQIIVKQPDMNQLALAFAAGWIKYEQKDFDGALADYGKGLAMYPHDHNLQMEYVSTLEQLQRGPDILSFVNTCLANNFDYDDTSRAKLFAAAGIGAIMVGDGNTAEKALQVSLQYNYDDQVKQVLDAIEAARAKAGKN